MSEIVVEVPATAGYSEQWGDWAILRQPPADTVVLDLSELQFADPLFLLRMRGFIDWHCYNGHGVRVVRPQSAQVRRYLSHMGLADELPERCVCEIAAAGTPTGSQILIPIRRLTSNEESDRLDDELATILEAQFRGPLGRVAEAFTATAGEMCDNATTHGASDVGFAYLSAQRYQQSRCVLAIGDLGIGIPDHIRRAFRELVDDEDAIRVATKEGVTATGRDHRRVGYQYAIDALKDSNVPRGELRVWSGRGRFRVEVRDGRQVRRDAWGVDGKTVGTWVRLELAVR